MGIAVKKTRTQRLLPGQTTHVNYALKANILQYQNENESENENVNSNSQTKSMELGQFPNAQLPFKKRIGERKKSKQRIRTVRGQKESKANNRPSVTPMPRRQIT